MRRSLLMTCMVLVLGLSGCYVHTKERDVAQVPTATVAPSSRSCGVEVCRTDQSCVTAANGGFTCQ